MSASCDRSADPCRYKRFLVVRLCSDPRPPAPPGRRVAEDRTIVHWTPSDGYGIPLDPVLRIILQGSGPGSAPRSIAVRYHQIMSRHSNVSHRFASYSRVDDSCRYKTNLTVRWQTVMQRPAGIRRFRQCWFHHSNCHSATSASHSTTGRWYTDTQSPIPDWHSL